MKHRFTALCTLLSLATGIAGTSAQKLKGSDTLLPLVQKTSESYFHSHPSAEITVTGGGSRRGYLSAEGRHHRHCHGLAPHEIRRTDETAGGRTPARRGYGSLDALAVVVNPANPVSKLTREQLEAIFRGKITNWKEVGGPDMRIVVYSRETSSGTYEFFKESVLRHRNYMASILSMPATGAVIQSVSQTPGAIGYVGLAYLGKKNIKPVSISYDGGKNYVAPNFENSKNRTYPVVRPLYFYYNQANEKRIKPYLDYLLSDQGQRMVAETGFIPVK